MGSEIVAASVGPGNGAGPVDFSDAARPDLAISCERCFR